MNDILLDMFRTRVRLPAPPPTISFNLKGDKKMMDQNQALNTLVQAVNLAQQRGAFNLKEAAVLSSAVEVFTPPAEETEVTEEVEEETE